MQSIAPRREGRATGSLGRCSIGCGGSSSARSLVLGHSAPLRRRPTPIEWKDAAAATGADLLDLAARAVRPNRSEPASASR